MTFKLLLEVMGTMLVFLFFASGSVWAANNTNFDRGVLWGLAFAAGMCLMLFGFKFLTVYKILY